MEITKKALTTAEALDYIGFMSDETVSKSGYFNTSEVIDYLNISKWKLRKLLSTGTLIPNKVISSNNGRNAYLYSPLQIVTIKRMLRNEGYKYQYN